MESKTTQEFEFGVGFKRAGSNTPLEVNQERLVEREVRWSLSEEDSAEKSQPRSIQGQEIEVPKQKITRKKSGNPESDKKKPVADPVRKFFVIKQQSNYLKLSLIQQKFHAADMSRVQLNDNFACFKDFDSWCKMLQNIREVIIKIHNALTGDTPANSAVYQGLQVEIDTVLKKYFQRAQPATTAYNSFLPTQFVQKPSQPPLPLDQDLVYGIYQVYTSLEELRSRFSNEVAEDEWKGFKFYRYGDKRAMISLKHDDINKGDALKVIIQSFYEQQMMIRDNVMQKGSEYLSTSQPNHLASGVGGVVYKTLAAVWQLLCMAPGIATVSVQHFLDYCLLLTDENQCYRASILAIITGAFVLNVRGQQIWAAAIDYCLQAFTDVIQRNDSFTLDYDYLVWYDKSFVPVKNTVSTDEVLNHMVPLGHRTMLKAVNMNLSCIHFYNEDNGGFQFYYQDDMEMPGFKIFLTRNTTSGTNATLGQESQVTLLFAPNIDRYSLIVRNKIKVFDTARQSSKNWYMNDLTYFVFQVVTSAGWIYKYKMHSSTLHYFTHLLDLKSKGGQYEQLNSCFNFFYTSRCVIYWTLRDLQPQGSKEAGPLELLDDMYKYLQKIEDDCQYLVYMTDFEQFMTYLKQARIAQSECLLRKVSKQGIKLEPNSAGYLAWSCEEAAVDYVIKCIPLCKTIEQIMTVRYLLMSVRAEFLEAANNYGCQHLQDLIHEKLDTKADGKWIVKFLTTLPLYCQSSNSPVKPLSTATFQNQDLPVVTPQFKQEKVKVQLEELLTGNMLCFEKFSGIPIYRLQCSSWNNLQFEDGTFDSSDSQQFISMVKAAMILFVKALTARKQRLEAIDVEPNFVLYNEMTTPDCERVSYYAYLATKDLPLDFQQQDRILQAQVLDKAVNIFRQKLDLLDEENFIKRCDYYDAEEETKLLAYLEDWESRV